MQMVVISFFFSIYLIILTLSAAILICVFFVQHNYQNAYVKNTKDWDIVDGAFLGNSNLDIPHWLNWFLTEISFHSIHNLSERKRITIYELVIKQLFICFIKQSS